MMADEHEFWGIYIPAQWVKGVRASSRRVAREVATKTLRGAIDHDVRKLSTRDPMVDIRAQLEDALTWPTEKHADFIRCALEIIESVSPKRKDRHEA